MTTLFKCYKGCCTIKVQPYYEQKINYFNNKPKKKAGMFIYDPNTQKILLVQSKGNLWGPPKGTVNEKELIKECAIREVKEETGLDISIKQLSNEMNFKNKAFYYYLEMKECEVFIQNHNNNDANGIAWINIDCLSEFIIKGNISLTRHCKWLINKILSKNF